MASGNIQTLDIQIKANAQKASNALTGLSNALSKVSATFHKLNSGEMIAFSKNINTVSSSLRLISNIKIDSKNIDSVSNAVKKISNINFGNSAQISEGIQKLTTSLNSLSAIKWTGNGIENIINSLNRLIRADISKFDTNILDKISGSIKSFSGIPDISSNINRLVSSIERIANSGSKATQVSGSLSNLFKELKTGIQNISGIANISTPVNEFVSSIAKLANAGSKTTQTASGLGSLATAILNFFNTMKNAPQINQSTLRMIESLAQISTSGRSTYQMTNNLRMSFSGLTKVLNTVGKSLKKLPSLFSKITSSSKKANNSIGSFGNSLRNILGAFGLYKGAQGIVSWIQSAIDLGSAITEVENVVDVAFGNMSQAAYDFATVAKEQFGISELSAKTYTGTMMSMLKASGIIQEDAAKMAIQIAGLAGDIASFYNIDTETAFTKIRAGLSGQVMPLRQLGISMTVANLNAYALAEGIGKTYAEMSQAEKTILRYNYLISVTSDQQNDFARTSNTWANQVRILKESFKSLSATLGQSFIAVLAPVVKALNALMSKLQQAAIVFQRFIYAITGYKPQGSQQGIVDDYVGLGDDLEGIVDGIGDIQEAGGGASGAIDDLGKSLSVLSFDQLNQLSDVSSAIGGSGGGSGSGSGSGSELDPGYSLVPDDYFDLNEYDPEEIVSEFFDNLTKAVNSKDWESFGRIIGEGINSGIQKIQDMIKWENVGKRITEIITALTTSFNSLVDSIDFESIGSTMGEGINTIINTLNLLITGVNWKNLGSKFAESVNKIFQTVNWENIGEFIGNKIMMLWDFLYGFFSDIKYDEIGISLAEGFNSIFEKINFETIAETLANALNGLSQILSNFVNNVSWDDVSQKLSDGINHFILSVRWDDLGKSLSDATMKLLGTIEKVVQKINWKEIGESIGEFLGSIDWAGIFETVASIIWEVLSGVIEGLWQSTSGKITVVLTGIAALFKGQKIIKSITTLVSAIGTTFGNIIPAISGIVGKLSTVFQGIGPVISKVGSLIGTAFSGITSVVSKGASGIVSGVTSIASALGPKGLLIAAVVAGVAALGTYIYQNWDEISQWLSDTWDGICKAAADFFGDLGETVSD